MKIAYLAKARPDLQEMIPPDVEPVMLQSGPGGVYSDDALAQVADADALVISMEPVNEQILAACKQLKIVQRLGVGYETLDLQAAAKRGIPCCNVPGANKEAVAEHGMTLLMALTRRLLEADRLTHELKWAEARLLTQHTFELYGKSIGIVGLGNTGSQLARRARAFGMRVYYNDIREIDVETIEATGAQFMEKDELFRTADIISVNTDLNDTTRNMIDARALALMKPSTLLVCCARGGIIDEAALRDALDSDRLAGAGIDVFSVEPIVKDNPLLDAKNCIVTSHVAGVTDETTRRIFEWAHDNVRAVVERGEKPRWVLNGV
ncbi:MAG TPA: NAD(P)-dependent oxidoreductase [bacterium]|nr:NAD(P)-dependent oxidoreductase [bacterium]